MVSHVSVSSAHPRCGGGGGRRAAGARSRQLAARRPIGYRCPGSRAGFGEPVVSSLSGWAQLGLRDGFLELTDAVWWVRAYGDFWSYCLVAEGAVDIAAEPEVSVWDLAALDILVREAGETFTSLDGAAWPAWRQRGGHQRAAARTGAAQACYQVAWAAGSSRRIDHLGSAYEESKVAWQGTMVGSVGGLPYPGIAQERTAVRVPGPPSRQPRLHCTVPQGKSRHATRASGGRPRAALPGMAKNDRAKAERHARGNRRYHRPGPHCSDW
jgi:Inositol monophosphatase family